MLEQEKKNEKEEMLDKLWKMTEFSIDIKKIWTCLRDSFYNVKVEKNLEMYDQSSDII